MRQDKSSLHHGGILVTHRSCVIGIRGVNFRGHGVRGVTIGRVTVLGGHRGRGGCPGDNNDLQMVAPWVDF